MVSFGNGSIVSARNRSRGTGVLRVEVEVPARGTLEQMYRALEGLVAVMRRDPAVAALATSELWRSAPNPRRRIGVAAGRGRRDAPLPPRTDLEREIRVRLNRRFLSIPPRWTAPRRRGPRTTGDD